MLRTWAGRPENTDVHPEGMDAGKREGFREEIYCQKNLSVCFDSVLCYLYYLWADALPAGFLCGEYGHAAGSGTRGKAL